MSVGRVGAYPARYGKLAKTLAWPGLAWEFRQAWQAIAWGLLITIGQVALACVLSGETHFEDAYLRLFQWDGHWYGHIAENGYRSSPHMHFVDGFIIKMSWHGDLPFGNVAFFPAYPLLGRFFHNALGLRMEHALLLTSQLGCWGMWSYLLLFFQRWGVSGRLAALGVAAVLIHPASYYLVASYSEPVFLMGVVGFLYWSGKAVRRMGPGVPTRFPHDRDAARRVAARSLALVPASPRWSLARRGQAPGPSLEA